MLVADGEVDMSLPIRGSIECALYEMLLHRCARSFCIVVEEQQSLWQLSVVQSLCLQHVGSDSLVVTLGNECLDALALILLADSIQLTIEGKLLDIVKILLLEISGRHVIVCIDKGKHVLEHTAGCTTGWHELHDTLAGSFILLPRLTYFLRSSSLGATIPRSILAAASSFRKGKPVLNCPVSMLNLCFADTLLGKLF